MDIQCLQRTSEWPQNYLSPSAWNRHTYLFADAFLASLENIGVWKCLKSGSFPIR